MKKTTAALIVSAAILATGCSTTPTEQLVTLSCHAEKNYDFIGNTKGINYWREMVTPKTLNSCRQVNYQKHKTTMTAQEIEQAQLWWKSRLTKHD